jgi:hypothetical protein
VPLSTEFPTSNLGVVGSNPSERANIHRHLLRFTCVGDTSKYRRGDARGTLFQPSGADSAAFPSARRATLNLATERLAMLDEMQSV